MRAEPKRRIPLNISTIRLITDENALIELCAFHHDPSHGDRVLAELEANILTRPDLPFRFSFGHALAARSSTTNLIVALPLDDGSTERIRCRAKYAPTGPAMDMVLTCASDAYKFNLSASVRAEGNAIAGSWTEASRNISGAIQGVAAVAVFVYGLRIPLPIWPALVAGGP